MADAHKSENKKNQPDGQLQQSQEAKFIGIIANAIIHSFNNSIGVIRGYADLVLRNTPSSDRNHMYLTQIIEEVALAKDLAEKLRIFTKQKRANYQFINIDSIIEKAIEKFRESSSDLIDIQQDIESKCGTVFADAGQIQQMVINLCDNALNAMSENGGILSIILKGADVEDSFAAEYENLREGKYLKLTVSDTGCGMEPNMLKQIYDPFFTVKQTGDHAGLGLSVVCEIVKGHKGEIIVESKLGVGTMFGVYLPLPDSDRNKKGEQ